ncbi:TIGR00730 family Rossman fold protein [Leucobacter sp. W1153]|uniref:LOG family protein n=1 Tax=Leucobacter sp. W1153 TaxID=3439064 RepID=UPI003F405E67
MSDVGVHAPKGAPDPELSAALATLLDEAGVTAHRTLVKRILTTGVGLGLDDTERLDLKISAAALEEMRDAFQLFAAHRGVPKVTIFGSARTQRHDPLFEQAEAAARGLADRGWMVVTGAGPGIMEAATIGAGPERSLGVSIRLPFEEKPNTVAAHDGRHVSMKYFFTRKLMLVKESRGFVCLPGGYGTMDETFELLTLQQTGKMVPVPIVLLDRPGGTFWSGFERFALEQLEGSGVISPGDLDRVLITDSVEEAVAEVTGFWRNYDSLRWDGERLVMRLRERPSDHELDALNQQFMGILESGRIERADPLPAEVRDNDRLHLARVVLVPQQRAVGELHRLVRALNAFESAPKTEAFPGDELQRSDPDDLAEPGLPQDPLDD